MRAHHHALSNGGAFALISSVAERSPGAVAVTVAVPVSFVDPNTPRSRPPNAGRVGLLSAVCSAGLPLPPPRYTAAVPERLSVTLSFAVGTTRPVEGFKRK